MDQEHLVESWVESGREILDHLAKESLTPAVAFWVKRPEKEFRVFYLATDWEPGSVYASLFRLPTLELSVGDIRLLNAGDALAQAAIAIRNRYPGRAATR